jgi:hypothetical protein
MILFVIAWIGAIVIEGGLLAVQNRWLEIPFAAASQGMALGLLFLLQDHERKRLVGVLTRALRDPKVADVALVVDAPGGKLPETPVHFLSINGEDLSKCVTGMKINNTRPIESRCGAVGPAGRVCVRSWHNSSKSNHTDGKTSWNEFFARTRGTLPVELLGDGLWRVQKPGLPPHVMGLLRTAGMVFSLLFSLAL